MKIKASGKVYTLQTAEGMDVIDISFCGRKDGHFVDGITNEELINILEDRFKFLVSISPTTENMKTLTSLQEAKQQINLRNFKKIKNKSNADTRVSV